MKKVFRIETYNENKNKISEYNKKILDNINQPIIDSINENNIDEVNKIININNTTIPTLNLKKLKNVIDITNKTTLITSNLTKVHPDKYKKLPNEGANYYDQRMKSFFDFVYDIDKHLKKDQTGNELIKNAIEINNRNLNYINSRTKMSSSPQSILNAYDFLKNNAKSAIIYDTETFSGLDKYGRNVLDAIQEMTFLYYDKDKNGKFILNQEKTVNTIIGPSEELLKEYQEKLVDNFSRGYNGEQKLEVIAERLARLGQKGTKFNYEKASEGIVSIETFAELKNDEILKEDILEGINRLREINKIQEENGVVNGIKRWEIDLFKTIKRMNNDSTAVASYNGIVFDNNKINVQAAELWSKYNDSQKKYILEGIFGEKNGATISKIPTLNTNGRHLDVYNLVKMEVGSEGLLGLYKYDKKNLTKIAESKRGSTTQEVIASIFAKHSGENAHASIDDTITLSKLIFGNEDGEKSFVDSIVENQKNKLSNSKSKLYKNSIFLATEPIGYGGSTNGKLNFTKDYASRIIINSGYSIDNNTVNHLGKFTGRVGIPKNTTFKINNILELNLSEEGIKKLREFDQEYAQGTLYSVILKPVIDKEEKKGNKLLEEKVVLFFKSLEEVEASFSSSALLIGKYDPKGRLVDLKDEELKEVKDKLTTYIIKDNKTIKQKASNDTTFVEQIVKKATRQLKNDPAARYIRDNMSYNKADTFLAIEKFFKRKNITVPEDKLMTLSKMTAKNVSRKKKISIDHELLKILTNKNGSSPHRSTLNNIISSYEYMLSNKEIIEGIYNSIDGNLSPIVKNILFSNRRDAVEKYFLYKKFGSDTNKIASRGKDAEIYKYDLNRFELKIPSKIKGSNNSENKILINLENGIYKLRNDVVKTLYGDKKLNEHEFEEYSKNALIRLMQTLNETDEYNGLFTDALNGINGIKGNNLFKEIQKEKKELRRLKGNFYNNELYNIVKEETKRIKDNPNDPRYEELNNIKKNKKLMIKKAKDKKNKDIENFIKNIEKEYDNDFIYVGKNNNIRISKSDYMQIGSDEKKTERVKKLKEKEIEKYKKERIKKLKSEIKSIKEESEEQYRNFQSGIRKELKIDKSKEFEELNNNISKKYEKLKELNAELKKHREDIRNYNSETISELFIESLKKAREDNPSIGIQEEVLMQNVIDSDFAIEEIKKQYPENDFEKEIIDIIERYKKNYEPRIIDAKYANKNDNDFKMTIENIVDEIFMPTKDIYGNEIKRTSNGIVSDIVKEAEKYKKFSKVDKDVYAYNLNAQRESYIEMVGNITEAIIKNNGQIIYDPNTRSIKMLIDGNEFNLNQLPKTMFADGDFYIKSGNNSYAANLFWNVDDAISSNIIDNNNIKTFDSKKVKVDSNIKKATRRSRGLSRKIEIQEKNGEEASSIIMRTVSKIYEEIRNNPSHSGIQEKGRIEYKVLETTEAMTNVLSILNDIDNYDGWLDEDFVKLIKSNRKQIEKGKISPELKEAFTKNMQDVLKIFVGIGAGNELDVDATGINDRVTANAIIATTLVPPSSAAENNMRIIGGINSDPTNFDTKSRPPVVSEKEYLFEKEQIKKRLEKYKLDKKVKLERNVVTDDTLIEKRSNAIKDLTGRFTFKNLSIDEMKLKEELIEKIDNYTINPILGDSKNIKEKLKELTTGINLSEQQGVVNGNFALAIDKINNQQIKLSTKNINLEETLKEKTMRRRLEKMGYELDIQETSDLVDIVFKLGEGAEVKRGTALFYENQYGGGTKPILSKINGRASIKLFLKDSDVEISEDNVKKILNDTITELDKNGIRRIKYEYLDDEDFYKANIEKVIKVLDDAFDFKINIENSFLEKNIKMTEYNSEKGIMSATNIGLGTVSSEAEKIARAYESHTGEKVYGRILKDWKAENIAKTLEEVDSEKYDFNKVLNIITSERDLFTNIFEDTYEDVVTISNNNKIGHKNFGSAFRAFLSDLTEFNQIRDNTNEEEAMKKTLEQIKSYNILENADIKIKDGKFYFEKDKNKEMYVPNIENIKKLQDETGLYSSGSPLVLSDSNGNIYGTKSTVNVAINEDTYTPSKSSDVKDIEKAIKEERRKLKKELRKSKDEKDDKVIESLKEHINSLEKEKNNRKILDKGMKISTRETNMLGVYEYSDNDIEYIKEKMYSLGEKGKEEFNNLYSSILDENGIVLKDKRVVNKELLETLNKLKERQYKSKYKETLENLSDAAKFNSSKSGDNFVEDILNKALSNEDNSIDIIHINDILTPNSGGDKFILKKDGNSVSKNFILNTGLEGDNKYVFIPKVDYSIMVDSENINTNEIQKDIAALKNRINDINAMIKGYDNSYNENDIKNAKTKAIDSIDRLKESIIEYKNKALKKSEKIELDNYTYQRATAATFNKTIDSKNNIIQKAAETNYQGFKTAKINGKTLEELMNNDIFYDTSWHSMEYFEDLGLFKDSTLKELNMTKEEMMEHLRTKGMFGVIESRTPIIREGSTPITYQFLDEKLAANEVKTFSVTALSRNQDQDGDSIIQGLAGKEPKDYIKYMKSKEKDSNIKINDKDKEFFEGIERGIHFRAMIVNPRSYEKTTKELREKQENAYKDNMLYEVAKSSSSDGKTITPYPNEEMDTNLYNEINKKYKKMLTRIEEVSGDSDITELEKSEQLKGIRKFLDDHKDKFSLEELNDFNNILMQKEKSEKILGTEMSIVSGKVSIGPLSNIFTRFRGIMEYDTKNNVDNRLFTNEQKQFFQATADVLEQNIISKKHFTDTEMTDVKKFKDAINVMINMGNGNKKESANYKHLDTIKDIINKHKKSIIDKVKDYSSISLQERTEEDIMDEVYKVFDQFNEYFASNTLTKEMYQAMTLGNYDHHMADTKENIGMKNKPMNKKGFEKSEIKEEIEKEIKEDSKQIASKAKKMTSMSLAKGALGIAAAIMMTGYIGGNPSIAPGTEANTLEENEQLQDEGITIDSLPQTQGQQGGYVININAESPKGKDYAMQAIQKAIGSTMPTDINISMNVNDNTKIYDQKYLNDLLSNAL